MAMVIKVAEKEKLRPRRRKKAAAVAAPLQLDPFQEQALRALMEGYTVLVAAPTGTGKTLIAERLIAHVLESGRGVVYTSPIKALSNQKYRDFGKLFGSERVGLITGDLSINERAPVLVMTTEIFRNWCFANPEELEHTSHVIFDEIHYLDDPERGTAWEESIIFAPPHIKILGLSATVPNVREIASWMAEVRGEEVKVVEERCRAVPLVTYWIAPGGEILDEEEARAVIADRQEMRRLYRYHWGKKTARGRGLES